MKLTGVWPQRKTVLKCQIVLRGQLSTFSSSSDGTSRPT